MALVINEISTYSSEDWVEIYSDSELDISGYELKDSVGNSKLIPENTTIGTDTNYYVVDFSNKLNKDEDTVTLYDKEKNQLDSVSYGKAGQLCAPENGQSIGRKPDGSGGFQRLANETRLEINTDLEAPCPTPKPDPTTTPTPNPTTNPEKTPTPKPTIAASPTPRVLSATSSPTRKSTPAKSEETKTSWTTPESESTAEPEAEVLSDTDKKISSKLIAAIFILAGGLFTVYPVVKYYKAKNEKND